MIDLHCHLLPELDDGARDINESLMLLTLAIEDGVRKLVVTPHIHPGPFNNSLATITPAFDALKQQVIEHQLPLQMAMAAEIRISPEIIPMVQRQQVPYLGELNGKNVMLLELPHSHIPAGSEKLVQWLLAQNILPLIAHPERNRDINSNLARVRPLVEAGCLLQLTAGSLYGRFGSRAQQTAEQLLRRGWIDVIASDSHSVKRRPPDLAAGFSAASKLVGTRQAWHMVSTLPETISAMHFQ